VGVRCVRLANHHASVPATVESWRGLKQSTAGVRLHAVGEWARVTGHGCKVEVGGRVATRQANSRELEVTGHGVLLAHYSFNRITSRITTEHY
jgi:hypothetical protein